MMMENLDIRKTHQLQKDGSYKQILTTITLSDYETQQSIVLALGKFWHDNGAPVEQVPGWVKEQMKSLSEKALKSVGFQSEQPTLKLNRSK